MSERIVPDPLLDLWDSEPWESYAKRRLPFGVPPNGTHNELPKLHHALAQRKPPEEAFAMRTYGFHLGGRTGANHDAHF